MNARAGALLAEGGGSFRALLEQQASVLHEVGEEVGTLPERMARAAESDCVVVAGGDGSVACAAQALAGTGTVLGVIPCGTMNPFGPRPGARSRRQGGGYPHGGAGASARDRRGGGGLGRWGTAPLPLRLHDRYAGPIEPPP